jgi:deoxyribonuclease V
VEWPADPARAIVVQERLRGAVRTSPDTDAIRPPTAVAGLDAAYSSDGRHAVGAVVVVDPATLEVLDQAVAWRGVDFPYVPGLLAFRELPVLLDALGRLATPPDLLLADGNGLLHPRRFGLACHLGVLTGLPTIGVAKSGSLRGSQPPSPARGAATPLREGDQELGRALRTQAGARPVFVSVGHRLDLDSACDHVLRLASRHRLPEPLRHADALARATVRAAANRSAPRTPHT